MRNPVPRPYTRAHAGKQTGLSLLELMISITIGTILMTGLVATFNQSGESRRELEKTGTLIENGRYAMDLIYEDMRHAGFYGHYYDLGDAPGTAPDPCEIADLAKLKGAISLPIQGFAAANLTTRANISATTCDDKGLFTNDNLKPGSDILVIRRADTAVFTGNPTDGVIYVQANARDMNVLVGNSSAMVTTDVADDAADDASTNLQKYPTKSATDPDPVIAAKGAMAADTRRFRVHVYFIAPCSYGSAADGVCQSGDDTVPTLKRLELSATGGVTAMEIVPLVEGVEFMKVRYGMDSSPTTKHAVTGSIGDGIPDAAYVATNSAFADWANVVSTQVNILVRATQETHDYTDAKSYSIAGVSAGPYNDHYRRRVYSSEALSVNMAGRREVPK